MQSLIKRLLKIGDLKDKDFSGFLKTTSKTTFVKAGGMGVGIIISITIGRLLGAEGLGIINLSNQIVGIMGMLIFIGLPAVIVKETSIAFRKNDWERIRDIIYTSITLNLPLAILIIGLGYLLIPWVVDKYFQDGLKDPLLIISTAIVFQVFSKILGSVLNGCRKIWQSSLVGDTLSAVFVGIGLLLLYAFDYKITVVKIAFLYAIARMLVSGSIFLYWRNINKHARKTSRTFIGKSLLIVALPLLFVQATNTIANSIDSIMIGSFLTSKDVGLYAVAFKIAFVSSFFLMVTNAVLAPKIASLYANKEIDELEKIIQKVTSILIGIGLFSLIIVIGGGKFILQVWGIEFSTAYIPLVVLSVGQFFNIAAGCVGLILTMCNQEKIWGYVTLGSAVLNTILNITFINLWGVTGAAIATASTMILVNILGVIIVKKQIGIFTIPIKLINR